MSAPQGEPTTEPSAVAPPAHSDSHNGENTTSSKQILAQAADAGEQPLSKNALKRLRKAKEWEEGKEARRAKKKEKRHERKARKRTHREELLASGVDPTVVFPKKQPSTLVPVSVVLDCDFEKYMTDRERISLASQVTRCYSDNKTARWKTHLWIAGWGGKLLERFEGPLERQHEHWKGVGFCEGDFAQAALEAGEEMEKDGGEMIESLSRSAEHGVDWQRDPRDPFPLPDPEPEPKEEYKNMVYLTSDSPYTITRLEPNKSYIVGGLVDRNREKGLCYRRARERGIRTAKLPIGQYMALSTRQVLATNHVVDIMLKWLEFEDWGKAFEAVIPKRKGGVLKSQVQGAARGEDGAEGEELDRDDDDAGEEGGNTEELAADTSQTEAPNDEEQENVGGS